MNPEDIKKLRADIGCTARELAKALGLEQKEVLLWERGETFPTKRYVDAMIAMKEGPKSKVNNQIEKPAPSNPWTHMQNPDLWAIVRKLLAHPELLARARKLADEYPDPADP